MLIGAATVLVILVAVFLSYNANKGLPFVPTYQVDAEVPERRPARRRQRRQDRRLARRRRHRDQAQALRDGSVIAVLELTLDKDAGPLPKDSTLIVRPRSALGLKYVELTRGKSRETYQDGDTITLAQAKTPVELDEFLNMFDEKTRAASQANLEGFGDRARRARRVDQHRDRRLPAAAERHRAGHAEPLLAGHRARALRARAEHTAALVAPAAETQASLFRNLDATMAALREVARPYIQDSITGGKPALDAGIESLPRQRPFLRNTEGLMVDLQPGVRALRTAAPVLSERSATGTEVLPKTPPLNRRLESLLQEVNVFADDPLVRPGIRHTTDLVKSLKPTLDYLAPTQTLCNYVTLWFRNISSLLSEGDRNGT